ncbi:MAG: hypothetical protein EG825_05805 [Rhodocyclaceae bacterium]|nr:hypothetical protein [Rhodocyclaceae bacterium]
MPEPKLNRAVKTIAKERGKRTNKSPLKPRNEELRKTHAIEDQRELSTLLRDRLVFLIDTWAPQQGKYKFLEDKTGIQGTKWQNLFLGKQKPTVEMLMAVASRRRQYAYWLLLGSEIVRRNGEIWQEVPDEDKLHAYQTYRRWIEENKTREQVDETP